jgi:hypothetical protein
MSRGLGWVQREILKVVDDGRWRTIYDLTMDVYENRLTVLRIPPSPKQDAAVRRAVQGLVAQGLVRRSDRPVVMIGRQRRVSVASHDCEKPTPAEITAEFDRLLALARLDEGRAAGA